MIKRNSQHPLKLEIITEYLSETHSFAFLGNKYSVNLRTIQNWVRAYRLSGSSLAVQSTLVNNEQDVRLLRKQLAQMELQNALLEEILRLSKEQTGIDFKKKYGTKQL